MRIYGPCDWEHCNSRESGKSILLVRVRSEDINPDRAIRDARHFVAYDVPLPVEVSEVEVEPIELTREFSAWAAADMLVEYMSKT